MYVKRGPSLRRLLTQNIDLVVMRWFKWYLHEALFGVIGIWNIEVKNYRPEIGDIFGQN